MYNTYKFISEVKLPNLDPLSGTQHYVQLEVFDMQKPTITKNEQLLSLWSLIKIIYLKPFLYMIID